MFLLNYIFIGCLLYFTSFLFFEFILSNIQSTWLTFFCLLKISHLKQIWEWKRCITQLALVTWAKNKEEPGRNLLRFRRPQDQDKWPMEASACGMLMPPGHCLQGFVQIVLSAGGTHSHSSSAWLMLAFPSVSASTGHSWKPATLLDSCYTALIPLPTSYTPHANHLFTPNWIKDSCKVETRPYSCFVFNA